MFYRPVRLYHSLMFSSPKRSFAALLRFALACELHNISSPQEHYDSYAGLLGPPADIYHVAERINTWWSCYTLARRLATVTGLPDGLPDFPDIVSYPISSVWHEFNLSTLKVTTVFPVPFSRVEQVSQALRPFQPIQFDILNGLIRSLASALGLRGQSKSCFNSSRSLRKSGTTQLFLCARRALL